MSLTPTSLGFGNQTINSTSSAQTVTVKNSGTATLNITGVNLTGTNSSAFILTSSCGSTLAIGASCTFQVAFAPTATGAMSATASIIDNAAGSPQSVVLSGTATSGSATGSTTTVHYSVNNLYFYNRAVGSASAPSTITVTNTGKANFTISSLTLTGAQASSFAASSNCANVAPKASCTLSVTFDPKIVHTNSAIIGVSGNAGHTSIPLTGHGY